MLLREFALDLPLYYYYFLLFHCSRILPSGSNFFAIHALLS